MKEKSTSSCSEDLELAARIEEFAKSPDIILDGNKYLGKYELNKASILDYLKNTLRKEILHNPAINGEIRLGSKGIRKLLSWGMNNEIYKKLFVHIPEITEKAVLLEIEKPNKPDASYNTYSHLAIGIQIDDKPYTVHLIIGENEGQWYYSHILLEIEKGSIPTVHPPTKEGHPDIASLYDIKDNTLLRLLQANSS
jgi:hypothetical protein